MAVPGNGEEHAAVAGVRHHDGGVAQQKRTLEDQVNTLAGLDHSAGMRIGEAAYLVSKDAGGVDHHVGLRGELPATFAVQSDDSIHEAILVLRDFDDSGVVQQRRIVIGSSSRKMDEQSRVVELAVVVDDAVFQPLRLDVGQTFECLLAGENARSAESVLAGEEVIDLEAYSIEWRLPP